MKHVLLVKYQKFTVDEADITKLVNEAKEVNVTVLTLPFDARAGIPPITEYYSIFGDEHVE